MSNSKNKKRNTMIGVGVVLALAVGVGTYYVSQSPQKNDDSLQDQLTQVMATKFFTYADNGVVKLYDSKSSSQLDSLELKTLSTGKEVVVDYLYAKSEDDKTLYVYNKNEKTFYSVSEKGNKIEGKVLFTASDVNNVTDFKVVGNKLYVVLDNGTKIREINLSTKAQKDYPLEGTSDLFTVHNGNIYYTFSDKLGEINLKTGIGKSIKLGDKSTDYIFTKDKLYILNQFGSQLNNSVLMKVNPSDLKVDDLVELKSNQTTILSEDENTATILIGQVNKSTDETNKVLSESDVLPIHASNLEKEMVLKNIPFDKNTLEMGGFIYEVNNGTADIYSTTNGKLVKQMKIDNATKVMPLK